MDSRQPYPLIRFLDGNCVLLELSAETFPLPQKGDELSLVLENGQPLSGWLVDRVSTTLPVRIVGEGDDSRQIPLVGLRVTTVELLRLGE